jgi:DNA-directed RNA polymerase specialized sigma24 family protein
VTFEDRVIFVHDVEKCLARLEEWDRGLVGRVILQGHSHWQAARMLHCSRRTIERRLLEVLDQLSEDFLKNGMLVMLPPKKSE